MIGLVNLRKLLLLKQKKRVHKFDYKGVRVRYGGSWYNEHSGNFVHFFSYKMNGMNVSTIESKKEKLSIEEIEESGRLLVDLESKSLTFRP